MASSDSKRECKNAYKIFPNIHDEGANKFHDGECAYQCKLELDDTCFKIHAPQTWEHDQGLLPIHTFEKKLNLKWQSVLNENYPFDYDAFLDFSMAFWVKSLDEYIAHWQSHENIDFEYIGIKWKMDWDLTIEDDEYTQNQLFYSILIHSPSSAINYEFISFHKPSHKLSKHMKWIHSDLPRTTFKTQTPWNRKDNAKIVPVRISRATTNIDAIYDFYINIMEATLVNYAYSDVAMEMDSKMSILTKTMFILLKDTAIELQFVERPNYYTTPDFSLIDYEHLLLETHETIITSPYCGSDRWFDNHYAYSAWTVEGLLDRVMARLNQRKIVYRLFKNPIDHTSVYAKENLEFYGVDAGYGLSVVEPTGQTFQIGGFISDPNVQRFAPVGNPQWCYEPCPGGLMEGHVDPDRIYWDSGDEDYIAPDNIHKEEEVIEEEEEELESMDGAEVDEELLFIESEQDGGLYSYEHGNRYWMHSIGTMVPILVCIAMMVHYVYHKNEANGKQQYNEHSSLMQHET